MMDSMIGCRSLSGAIRRSKGSSLISSVIQLLAVLISELYLPISESSYFPLVLEC